MKPIYLYIENFMCHEKSELDLSIFNSALIIGTIDGNDLYSNGTGKSTIFKAIEFCIFNECAKGLKLEKLVRDETDRCKVVFDFESQGKIYRLSRSRTKKGVSDLSLYERTSHEDPAINPHTVSLKEEEFKKFWADISSRRVPDTEETLEKIHKMNYKSFCSGYYFAQNDFTSGLATATKGERKTILKDSLGLVVYNYLQKLANTRALALSKDIDKKKAVFDSMGDPTADIVILKSKIKKLDDFIAEQAIELTIAQNKVTEQTNRLSDFTAQLKILSEQVSTVLKKKSDVSSKITRIQLSFKEYTDKRKVVIAAAKALAAEIEELKSQKAALMDTDYSQVTIQKENLEKCKEALAERNALIRSTKSELVELRIPLPNEDFCKHCRQPLTDAHRLECENSTNQKIAEKEKYVADLEKEVPSTNASIKEAVDNISRMELNKKKLEATIVSISSKEKEMADKKVLFTDYDSILKEQKLELDQVQLELDAAIKDVDASSAKELEELKNLIQSEQTNLNSLKSNLNDKNRLHTSSISEKAVLEHSIEEKSKSIQVKLDLGKEIVKLEDDYSSLPDILEAYGPTGIPNLIIQNVLDDFQIEANKILNQIRPGLQLSFLIEKTKGDGQLDDDLEIEYFLNGKSRDYSQLSGAQKLDIMFALKLGLAYLQKNLLGTSMRMLLLDEVDPALDKAGVDAFADVIKFFQKDFTILVITHDDRLKSKFSYAILVDQNQNMVSTAKVVSSW